MSWKSRNPGKCAVCRVVNGHEEWCAWNPELRQEKPMPATMTEAEALSQIREMVDGPPGASYQWIVEAVEVMRESLITRTRELRAAERQLKEREIPPGGKSW